METLDLKQDDHISFDNGSVKGRGKIKGESRHEMAILGRGFIIELDNSEQFKPVYNYSHIVMDELYLKKI
jgi:hypothetical protein